MVQVGTVCAAAACLAALVVTGAGSQRRAVLMSDESLTASTIGMDHTAMLAGNSQQNAAFLQTFGSFEPNQAPTLATGTTQLAQSSQTPPAAKKSAASRLNAKLAAQMQASLTAGTQGDSLMTPHFVAALEQATGSSRNQMLSQQQAIQQKATMDALTMTQSTAHILPANLRQKFAITSTKSTLGSFSNLTPQQAAMRVAPMEGTQSLSQAAPSATGGDPASASKADSSFLSAEPAVQLTAKQLIQQAALKQMNAMPAPAVPAPTAATKPAPVQQLAQYPAQQPMEYRAVPQYAPMQTAYQQPQVQQPQMAYQQPQQQQYAYQQPLQYAAPQQQYAQTQMAYQVPQQQAYNGYYQSSAQPSMYPAQQAATQQMYQMAAPAPYQAPQQMLAQPVQQPYTADPVQANVNTASPVAMMAYQPPQQLAMPQPQQGGAMVDSSNVGLETPAEIGAAAANSAAAGNWRAPDLSITAKGAKGKISAAARNSKIKQQMLSLRSSILADYKKNSKMANTALLLGPGGL